MISPETLAHAQQVFPFLRNLTAATTRELQQEAQLTHITAGSFICMAGDVSRCLPLIVHGEARIYDIGTNGREITLYRIGPGESCVLTVASLLYDEPFPAHARAATDLEALTIAPNLLRRWMHQDPALHHFILGLLSQRLARLVTIVNQVTFHQMDSRLAHYLVHKVGRTGSHGIDITHESIATELGSSREVVSRLLKHFEREGLVSLSWRRIDVENLDQLRQRAAPNGLA